MQLKQDAIEEANHRRKKDEQKKQKDEIEKYI